MLDATIQFSQKDRKERNYRKNITIKKDFLAIPRLLETISRIERNKNLATYDDLCEALKISKRSHNKVYLRLTRNMCNAKKNGWVIQKKRGYRYSDSEYALSDRAKQYIRRFGSFMSTSGPLVLHALEKKKRFERNRARVFKRSPPPPRIITIRPR